MMKSLSTRRTWKTYGRTMEQASGLSRATHQGGCRVRFYKEPTLTRLRDHPQGVPDENAESEWQELVTRGIARIIHDNDGLGFHSPSFVIPKKNKKELRLTSDLRSLNAHCVHRHFKMRGTSSTLKNIEKSSWFISFDVKDGHFNAPIHETQTKCFRFVVNNTCYELQRLPMGFVGSAAAFGAWLKPHMDTIRSLLPSMSTHDYADDCLVVLPRSDPGRARELAAAVVHIMQVLHLPMKLSKSILSPTRIISHLGFSMDSRTLSISVPPSKAREVCKQLRKTLRKARQHTLRLNVLASAMGKMIALLPAVPEGRLHASFLHSAQTELVNQFGWKHYRRVHLDLRAKSELTWWLTFSSAKNTRPISSRFSSHELRVAATDASDHTIAGTLMSDASLPHWWRNPSRRESRQRINLKELLAVRESLSIHSSQITGKHINMRSDGTTVVSASNKWGTRDKTLTPTLLDIFSWCLRTDTLLTATHTPTHSNKVADTLSRGGSVTAEHAREMFFLHETMRPKHLHWNFDARHVRSMAKVFKCRSTSIKFPQDLSKIETFLQSLNHSKTNAVALLPLWPAAPWFNAAARMAASLPVLAGPSLAHPSHQRRKSRPLWGWIGFRSSTSKNARTRFRRQLRSAAGHPRGPKSIIVLDGGISQRMLARFKECARRFLWVAAKAKS